MTQLETETVVSDVQLVMAVRTGDHGAMAELYTRHTADAVRVARIVDPEGDPEELAAEAFTRVLAKIVEGGGPTEHFRAYLHTVIRNLTIERNRQANRELPASDKLWLLDTATQDDVAEVDTLDETRAARALRALPQNWRLVLWKLAVDRLKPAEIAAELSVPAATVSDTAYRAREGLRLAYLDTHVPPTADKQCTWSRDRLSRHARGRLSPRAADKIWQHLEDCTDCALLHAELDRVNRRLGGMLGPTVRAAAATAVTAAVAVASMWLIHDDADAPPSPPRAARAARSESPPPAASLPPDAPTTQQIRKPSTAAGPAVTSPGSPHATPPPREGPELSAPAVDTPGRAPAAEPTPAGEPDPAPTPVPIPVPIPVPVQMPVQMPVPVPDPDPEHSDPVDLGIASPRLSATGNPHQWSLTVPVLSDGGAESSSFTLVVELRLNAITGVIGRQPNGWDCGPIQDGRGNGDPYLADTVSCTYSHQPGRSVAPLVLTLESIAAPSGTLTVSAVGHADPSTADNTRHF